MLNLQSFSSADKDRPKINEPWSDGEFSYATDGHILVRIPRQEGIRDASEVPDGALDMERFKEDLTREIKDWYSVPDIEVKKEICPQCNGSGKAYTCPECDGMRYVTASTDYSDYDDLDCATCNTTGIISEKEAKRLSIPEEYFKCDRCSGTGYVLPNEKTKIGSAYFSNCLLVRLSELPNCEIGVFDADMPAQIKFDGGIGLLMPTRV